MSSKLQREIKKRQPFGSLEEEALLNLVRTQERFQNRTMKLFREHGLTPSQYNVLRILRGEGQPLPSLEIADRMVHVVPAITGLIDRLEKAKLVQRRRCQQDRRVVYVEITAKALSVLKKIEKPLQRLNEQLIGHLSQTELRELIRLLEKARESYRCPSKIFTRIVDISTIFLVIDIEIQHDPNSQSGRAWLRRSRLAQGAAHVFICWIR